MKIQFPLLTFLMCCCLFCNAQNKTDQAGNVVGVDSFAKPSMISVIFFQFTENGIGFGGAYERRIDKKGRFAFYLPAMVTFNVANSNRIYDYNTGNYNTGKADAMYYTMPGIKFYPTGCNGKIKYAAGLSLVAGSGQKSSYMVDLYGLNTTELVQSHFIAGGMFQNSVNINTAAHLCMGAELGVGSTFINHVGGVNVANEFLIQGSVRIGYRF